MKDQIIARGLKYISRQAKDNPNHYGWVELLYERNNNLLDVESFFGEDEKVTDFKMMVKLHSLAKQRLVAGN